MRTKQVVVGFKNSQKIRVIIDGVGIYMTVAETDNKFATTTHRLAVSRAINQLASTRAIDKARDRTLTTGFGSRFRIYDAQANYKDVDVQVDLV